MQMNLKIDKLEVAFLEVARWLLLLWLSWCLWGWDRDISEYLVIVLLASCLQIQTQELGIQVGCTLAFFPVALIDHIDAREIMLHKGILALQLLDSPILELGCRRGFCFLHPGKYSAAVSQAPTTRCRCWARLPGIWPLEPQSSSWEI